MASNHEKEVTKIKQEPEVTPNEKSKSRHTMPLSKNKFLPFLAFFVAFGALAIAAHTLLLNKQLQKQFLDKNLYFSTTLKQLEKKQLTQEQQIHAKIKDTEEVQTALRDQSNALGKQIQNALNQKFYQNQDWLLMKARYYLELAQINAHWTQERDTTLSLLEQADQLLKQYNNPQIFAVRQALAKDITQLQSLEPLDISGLLSQLDAIQNQVNDLKIAFPAENTPAEPLKPDAKNASSWQLHLKNSAQLLQKLVVVQHYDKNIKPFLSPFFESMSKESLHLTLQEAQWAVLNNNSVVYQMVLTQAIYRLKMNFNEQAPATAALIKKLVKLQDISFPSQKITVDSALPLLNELIDTNKPQLNQTGNNEQGDQ